MHIAAVWVLVVVVGVALGLTVLCFLFTRCCTKRRLPCKKRAPKIPPRKFHNSDDQPPSSPRPDNHVCISSLQQSMYPHLLPKKLQHPPQDKKNVDETFSEDDYSSIDHYCVACTSTHNPHEDMPPPSPSMYEIPMPLSSSHCNTSLTPISLQTQGDKSSTLRLIPPAGSDMSYSCEEMPTISFYSTASSLMPITKKSAVCAQEAGEGTSTGDHVQTLQRPGHYQQDKDKRFTMVKMKLPNLMIMKIKMKMDK